MRIYRNEKCFLDDEEEDDDGNQNKNKEQEIFHDNWLSWFEKWL